MSQRSTCSRPSAARLSSSVSRSRPARSGQSFVVTNTSPRGTPPAASTRPTSRSLPYMYAVSTWRYPSSSAERTARSTAPPRACHVPSPSMGICTPGAISTLHSRVMPASCRAGTGSARGRLLALPLVHSLGELLDHLLVERRDVVRLAAGHEPVVDDDLLVDPAAAGVPDVGLQARPRRHLAVADAVRLDQHPRAVADHRDGLPLVEEVAREPDHARVHPHLVRVADASRDQQRVVVGGAHRVDRRVAA